MHIARAASNAGLVGMSMLIGYKLMQPNVSTSPPFRNDKFARRIACSPEVQPWEIKLPFEPTKNKVLFNEFQTWMFDNSEQEPTRNPIKYNQYQTWEFTQCNSNTASAIVTPTAVTRTTIPLDE
jgi:hypothetical protein